MIKEFYKEAAGKRIITGIVIAYQTFGDMLRFNPHFHAIVLEGGFDEDGNFLFIPFSGLEKMSEYFRRKVINLFLEKNLITKNFSRNLLGWKHSGFSIDNSVRIFTDRARTSLTEYISRAPVSLKSCIMNHLRAGSCFIHATISILERMFICLIVWTS
jgi:Putative transposase